MPPLSQTSRAVRLGCSRDTELKGFAEVKVFSLEMMTSICRQAGLKDPRLVRIAFEQIDGRDMTAAEVAAMAEADLERSQAEDVVGIGRTRVPYADRASTRWKLLARDQPVEPMDAQPEAAKPMDAQPEADQPVEPMEPMDAQPEDAQPEDAQPEADQPMDAQPEDAQPEADQPMDAQPEDAQPEADAVGCSKCRHSVRGCRACNPAFVSLRPRR
jgi:hypothetical protein